MKEIVIGVVLGLVGLSVLEWQSPKKGVRGRYRKKKEEIRQKAQTRIRLAGELNDMVSSLDSQSPEERVEAKAKIQAWAALGANKKAVARMKEELARIPIL